MKGRDEMNSMARINSLLRRGVLPAMLIGLSCAVSPVTAAAPPRESDGGPSFHTNQDAVDGSKDHTNQDRTVDRPQERRAPGSRPIPSPRPRPGIPVPVKALLAPEPAPPLTSTVPIGAGSLELLSSLAAGAPVVDGPHITVRAVPGPPAIGMLALALLFRGGRRRRA